MLTKYYAIYLNFIKDLLVKRNFIRRLEILAVLIKLEL